MRILFTVSQLNYTGGVGTYVSYLCENLSDRHEITIACPASCELPEKLIRQKNIQIIPVEFRFKFLRRGLDFCGNLKAFHQLCKRMNFDIIHVNGSAEVTFACFLKVVKYPCKIIFTKHGQEPFPSSVQRRLKWKYTIDHMICVAQDTSALVAKHMPSIDHSVVCNGIDLNYFKPVTAAEKAVARKQFGLVESDFVFVSVAGTAKSKGWQYLMHALRQLPKQQRKHIKILLAGQPIPDAMLNQFSDMPELIDSMVYVGQLNGVRPVIAAGDVGFVLSTSETISFACREMMAMGRPVLVSCCGGLPENVTEHRDGWISKQRDVEGIHKIVAKILTMPKEDLMQMGSHASDKAKEHFCVKAFVKKTEAVYLKVMGD